MRIVGKNVIDDVLVNKRVETRRTSTIIDIIQIVIKKILVDEKNDIRVNVDPIEAGMDTVKDIEKVDENEVQNITTEVLKDNVIVKVLRIGNHIKALRENWVSWTDID